MQRERFVYCPRGPRPPGSQPPGVQTPRGPKPPGFPGGGLDEPGKHFSEKCCNLTIV